jgi:hypothetical protein
MAIPKNKDELLNAIVDNYKKWGTHKYIIADDTFNDNPTKIDMMYEISQEVDFDLEFFMSIGEESGIYINGDMIKTDEKFLELIGKIKSYYEKFKSKWAKILAQRKKTKPTEE